MTSETSEPTAVSGLVMRAFPGRSLPPAVRAQLTERPPAGITVFRGLNIGTAGELRELTAQLQAAVPADSRPLLIATDQEGGQFQALGDFTTPFAGAMALGAAGDEQLAEAVARAVGRELRALGVNVNYAPVCDLATEPANPGLGIRSFGDDAQAVARLAAATVRGLQVEGVAATVKHFPGKGDAAVDTHHRLAVVERTAEQLAERELVPFRAALDAGARLVMSGHFALPALTGDATLPCTLAERINRQLLREELGFEGLAITDALDMKALAQGPAQLVEVLTALRAGQDLLLGTHPLPGGLDEALAQAVQRGLLAVEDVAASLARLAELRSWLATFEQPSLEVVGSAGHRQLAGELARRSITLVRDDEGLLPLRPAADERILVIAPKATDLTPADTSSYLVPELAGAIRLRHAATDELLLEPAPTARQIHDARARAGGYALVVLATVSAHNQAGQAELAGALLALGRPLITVALRTPWDLLAYPQAATHLCSYGAQPPTIEALAAALFGESGFSGRLPVALGSLYQRGHGQVSAGAGS